MDDHGAARTPPRLWPYSVARSDGGMYGRRSVGCEADIPTVRVNDVMNVVCMTKPGHLTLLERKLVVPAKEPVLQV